MTGGAGRSVAGGGRPKAARRAGRAEREAAARKREREASAARAVALDLVAGMAGNLRWHVALVCACSESAVAQGLVRAGWDAYWPCERVTALRRGATVEILRPLFPRYVFFAGRAGPAGDVHAVKGLVAVLSDDGGVWLALGGAEVARLARAERAGLFDRTVRARLRTLAAGDSVVIVAGPLAGWPAEIVSIRADKRVNVLVKMLGGGRRAILGVDRIAFGD